MAEDTGTREKPGLRASSSAEKLEYKKNEGLSPHSPFLKRLGTQPFPFKHWQNRELDSYGSSKVGPCVFSLD